jgi:hypothetical protein
VQVKLDAIGTNTEQPGAFSRFGASQIASQPMLLVRRRAACGPWKA